MKFKLIVDSKRGVWGAYGKFFRPGKEYPVSPEIAEAAENVPGLTVIELDTKGKPISVKEATPILVKEIAPKKKGKKEKPFIAEIKPIIVPSKDMEELDIKLKSVGAKPLIIKEKVKEEEKAPKAKESTKPIDVQKIAKELENIRVSSSKSSKETKVEEAKSLEEEKVKKGK